MANLGCFRVSNLGHLDLPFENQIQVPWLNNSHFFVCVNRCWYVRTGLCVFGYICTIARVINGSNGSKKEILCVCEREKDEEKWRKVMNKWSWSKLIIWVPNVDRWAIGYFIEDVQEDVKYKSKSQTRGGVGCHLMTILIGY